MKRCLFLSVAALCVAPLAMAQTAAPRPHDAVQISPITIDLTKNNPIQTLKLTNKGKDTLLFKTKEMKWTQADNKNIYTPTKDLIVSPPIFKLAPDKTQVVRIALKQPEASTLEKAYRVYFSEVFRKPSNLAKDFKGVFFTLNLGVPVFVAPKGETKHLVFNAKHMGKRKFAVMAKNDSNIHVKIKDINLAVVDSSNGHQAKVPLGNQAFTYILPKQSKQLVLNMPKNIYSCTDVKLVANTNWGSVKKTLSM
jgi:fimbrial chaperone protein